MHPSPVPRPSNHAYSFAANLPSLDVEGCKQGVLERAVLLRLAQVVVHLASGGEDALDACRREDPYEVGNRD